MSKVAIVTDTNAGFTPDEADRLGITIVPMPFMIGENTYYEGINLTRDDFFAKQNAGEDIVTSQPAPTSVLKIWDEVLSHNDSIVYIPMSSGLSGSCQSSAMLSSEYDGRVQVVNNQRISVTQKASVKDALEFAKRGKSAQEIKDILEKEKFDASIYIMVDTLKYLKKGGRITPAAAAIGSLLRIKPVLMIRGERLDAFSKARTVNQAKQQMINAMKHDIETQFGGSPDNVHLYAVESRSPQQFPSFYEEVKAAFPGTPVEHDVLSLSICTHIGEGALAIACDGKLDYDKY